MNAPCIVYALVGEVVFAAWAGAALLAVAALLRLVPSKVLRGEISDYRGQTRISANGGTDTLNELEESVIRGMQASACEQSDEPTVSAIFCQKTRVLSP